MAIANLIGAAIGVFLLILVAYLLVGATLLTAETVMAAQRDMTEVHAGVRGSSVSITGYAIAEENTKLYLMVKNDGDTVIQNPQQMDLFLAYEDGSQERKEWTLEQISPDIINPGFLDPGETLNMSTTISGEIPIWAKVATPTGSSASGYIGGG